jgi:hypothetical protein
VPRFFPLFRDANLRFFDRSLLLRNHGLLNLAGVALFYVLAALAAFAVKK